jgi:O-phosphoseryl-tRNA(Cys) synthetase
MEKKEIHSILEDYRKGEIGTDDAIYEILRLFSVSTSTFTI